MKTRPGSWKLECVRLETGIRSQETGGGFPSRIGRLNASVASAVRSIGAIRGKKTPLLAPRLRVEEIFQKNPIDKI